MGVLLLLILGAAGGPVTGTVELHPSVIPFYETAHIQVRVSAPPGTTVDFPATVAVKTPGYRANTVTVSREKEAGETTASYRVDVTWPGIYTFQPMRISWKAADGTRGVLLLSIPTLNAREITREERASLLRFAPDFPPEAPSPPWTRPGIWLAGLLLAGSVGLISLLAYRARNRSQPAPRRPVYTLSQQARKRLAALQARRLPEKGQYEEFYTELADILREYLAGWLALSSREQTTPELLAALADSGRIDTAGQQQVEAILRQADRVKFALTIPRISTMTAHLEDAFRFVDENRRAET